MDLPVWASSIIIGAVSTAVTAIVGAVINRHIRNYFNTRDKKTEDAEKYRYDQHKKERTDETTEIVKNCIKPLAQNIDVVKKQIADIQQDRALERDATVVTLRIKMMELRDTYTAKGYCDSHEKATWDELYNRYRDLGGNHFLEYVDQYKKEIHDLPDTPKIKSKKTKSVL